MIIPTLLGKQGQNQDTVKFILLQPHSNSEQT